MGTPITGRVDQAAAAPGRWAAMPAPATITLMPRSRAPLAHSDISAGVRWADSTLISDSIPISVSVSAHFWITGRSDLLPTTIPTSTNACLLRLLLSGHDRRVVGDVAP